MNVTSNSSRDEFIDFEEKSSLPPPFISPSPLMSNIGINTATANLYDSVNANKKEIQQQYEESLSQQSSSSIINPAHCQKTLSSPSNGYILRISSNNNNNEYEQQLFFEDKQIFLTWWDTIDNVIAFLNKATMNDNNYDNETLEQNDCCDMGTDSSNRRHNDKKQNSELLRNSNNSNGGALSSLHRRSTVAVSVEAKTTYRMCTTDPQGDEDEDTFATIRTHFLQTFRFSGGKSGRIVRGNEVVEIYFVKGLVGANISNDVFEKIRRHRQILSHHSLSSFSSGRVLDMENVIHRKSSSLNEEDKYDQQSQTQPSKGYRRQSSLS
eukprot:CAMPEP_0171309460 /NCGR_PEP_ID=MMETSP0816-20121228/19623_1 /TAXON_ID=420281 /ORGANISM="Proboscia inermis, Strain CCAP1064/1" /LENGTH=323 /DNA_ID=CAMNT_0011792995 /DNA_START=86 /DNA_END=1057 /DNA_ORIENTATION=+